MQTWRPPQKIHAKVLGLAWHQDRLLAAEVTRDDGTVKGIRPPGGTIEFGETREEALAREFQEEFGCGIAIEGSWRTFENLFWHEGARGHEFIFAANIRLLDESLYRRSEITLVEHDRSVWTARWFMPQALPEGVELYPSGLAAHLAPL
ncbi:NUDIX domain-containing protein [Shinella kummerowiae]|uniref:NUDIX domain-containing protein n=1 Tax=Shinella kummerowiae TaxID=417745 RepID=A0A6N8SJ75_9HYPH|nr:NUDIX domain-containing protein [Shinella kummerowiae]MXN46860.1 NUDIX domain-containing protein [Shinella kummerowiae]